MSPGLISVISAKSEEFTCLFRSEFTDHSFDLQPVLFVAAVVNSVCMKEKDVSWAHQCDFRQVRGVHLPFPELHGKILIPVRMVLGNFQPERKEPYHAILVDLHDPSVFCGEYQRWRV